ncbi:MAG: response regulator [Rhizobiales bacterium]|nr:response regulator [Hyphomicrobiales bacterium]
MQKRDSPDVPSSSKKHILIVDDDAKVRLLLRRCFEQDGYGVSEAATEVETMQYLAAGGIDLVTLDLTLGAEDGLNIAREIRAISSIPIVMVTGKGDTIDRVVGLELGADDYISKPFHVREVLARIRSVLRRTDTMPNEQAGCAPQDQTDSYAFGDWTVDFSRLQLRSEGGELRDLTTSEFKLLEILVKNAKRVLTRDQIMDKLKGHDWSPLDRSIDNQIARLRRKIEADPKKPALIKTVRGAGYTFAVDVNPC